jgi:hypothetical protein
MSPIGGPDDECVGPAAATRRPDEGADEDDDSPAARVVGDPPRLVTVEPVAGVVALAGRAVVGEVEATALGPTVPVAGVACAPTVDAGPVATVERGVLGTVVRATVVGGGAGTHVAAALADPRGGGSVGNPEPSGCHRQPSTTPLETRHEAGPKLLYVQLPFVPWK